MTTAPHLVRFLDLTVPVVVTDIAPVLLQVDGEWLATKEAFETILRAWRDGATDREPRGWRLTYGGGWDDFVLADLDPTDAAGVRLTVVEYDTVHDRHFIPSSAVVYHLEALPFEVEVERPTSDRND